MAVTNHERVGKALELLNRGLLPFVEREMKASHGKQWKEAIQQTITDRMPLVADQTEEFHLDTQALLTLMWDCWNDVFRKTLGHTERSIVSELREIRNQWAHQRQFSSDDTYRVLDNIQRLLNAVLAVPEAEEAERMKQEVLRIRFDEQARYERRKRSIIEGQPTGNLPPWRQVVTPHQDVANGTFQHAEFAADLWQVYLGGAKEEYQNPREFFRRTYLTEGLRQLLKGVAQRLSGTGGDPVIELQTNFGGGKTHSLLALLHLFSGISVTELPGADEILQLAELSTIPKANTAVFVGTKFQPASPSIKPDGTIVNTIWGDIAWQLGKKEGYEFVRKADESGTNPGDVLREVFDHYAPCLILIDEWVAYARQLANKDHLPAGSFDTQFTFAQTLCESARAAKQTAVIVSVPVSNIEVGGDAGKDALQHLRNAIGRMESPWKPASTEESFEIVRRRLFEPIRDAEKFKARDAVAQSFVNMYRENRADFAPGCGESSYYERIRNAYPIHPELFDRLYDDWSSLERFQRTRGVLRLMATVIHNLWTEGDTSLLIMPGTVPIDSQRVSFELTRYLEDNWAPIIEKDIDGIHAIPSEIDKRKSNLGRFSACRRVARTVFMGSAPKTNAAQKGIDDRHIKLGCVQPGESPAMFGDALRSLSSEATHLYVDGTRYWYGTQPTVTRLAQDRAAQQDEHTVNEEIKKRLRQEQKKMGDFTKVYPCVSSSDIPDETEARLVILGPEYPHLANAKDSPARVEAEKILNERGTASRQYKNTLVFLVPERNRLDELQQAVRQYLAWKSIAEDVESLNLDSFQQKQAVTKREDANRVIEQRIPETYNRVLVPTLPDPNKNVIEWQECRQQGAEPLAVRASKKLIHEELLVTMLVGSRLRIVLDRCPGLWRSENHTSTRQLADDFSRYLYLPRIKNWDVLRNAIAEGTATTTWEKDTFAFAEGWDEDRQRYIGLVAGQNCVGSLDSSSLLVKSEVAVRQIEEEEKEKASRTTMEGTVQIPAGKGVKTTAGESSNHSAEDESKPAPAKLKRFYGTVVLDSIRTGKGASTVADEVISHLAGLMKAKVEVTLEIHATIPDGAPDQVVRTVSENCRTLKFREFGFEEE